MAELTLNEKLSITTAKVVEVKTDPANKRGVVSVEIVCGNSKWYKPFGVSFEQGKIKWADFKEEVRKAVRKDLEKDLALSEIKAKEGVVFDLFGKVV